MLQKTLLKRSYKFQRKANVLLQKTIETKFNPKIKYLDHRRFLGINCRKLWKMTSFTNILQQDGVHLKVPLYNKMISILIKRFLLREPANNYTSGPG